MKIKIICVGKLKEEYLKDGINEYTKRIKRFADVEIMELPDEKIPEKASDSEKNSVIAKEGERILKHIGKSEYVVSLCIEGKQFDSESFAQKISEVMTFSGSTITFVIGGSLGIAPEIKSMSQLKLSFSKMTFPHQLARLSLLEQVYRAFKINGNEEYHK